MEGAGQGMNKARPGLSGTRRSFGLLLVGITVAVAPLLGGCQAKPDPNREFAMTMNGEDYFSHLGPAFGSLEEIEAGFSTQVRCHIVFPLRLPGEHNRPGVEIAVDPQRITPGQEIVFGQGETDSGVELNYIPAHGHKMSEGIMLSFA